MENEINTINTFIIFLYWGKVYKLNKDYKRVRIRKVYSN